MEEGSRKGSLRGSSGLDGGEGDSGAAKWRCLKDTVPWRPLALEWARKLEEMVAQQEGCCSQWCPGKQKGGKKARKEEKTRGWWWSEIRHWLCQEESVLVARSRGAGGEGYWRALPGDFEPL